jgi:arylsulfatase A-like enzyme
MDNTFIIFMSDNGYYQGEHGGLYDKRSAYEESIRVPMVIRYPRLIKPGTKVDKMVLNIDVAPTFLELAGVPIPKSMQGRSMVPVLAGRDVDWRKSFLIEYFREQGFPSTPTLRGVRTDRYKYVTYIEPPDRSELYDLKDDPRETKNLYDDAAHATVVADLKKELDRLMTETRFPADLRQETVLPPNLK